VKQAPGFNCCLFDPFSLFQNGLATPEVDGSGRKVLKALMIALVVAVLDEAVDLLPKIA